MPAATQHAMRLAQCEQRPRCVMDTEIRDHGIERRVRIRQRLDVTLVELHRRVARPGDSKHRRREIHAPRHRAARTCAGREQTGPASDVEHVRATRNLRRIEQCLDEPTGRACERRFIDAGCPLPARMFETADSLRIE